MIAVDEDEFDARLGGSAVSAGGLDSGLPHPTDGAVTPSPGGGNCDLPLNAEPQPPAGEGVDRPQDSVRGHRAAQPSGGDAVPDADFDQPAPPGRVPG